MNCIHETCPAKGSGDTNKKEQQEKGQHVQNEETRVSQIKAVGESTRRMRFKGY